MKDRNNREERVIYDAKEVMSVLETPILKDSEVIEILLYILKVYTHQTIKLYVQKVIVLCHVLLSLT